MKDAAFTVAIIGTGLMGGSLGYALRGFRDCLRVGYDADRTVLEEAIRKGAVDSAAISAAEAVKDADLSIFCTKPSVIISEIKKAAGAFRAGSVVTEICGVKAKISREILEMLPFGIHYAGLHPMAGKEVGGFENADGTLFQNAGFIIVSPDEGQPEAVALLRAAAEYVGAGRVCVNTPEAHDRIIGYSSDLMHISATALCADYPKDMTLAYTAGAYRDCTRIAEIDAALWTELLMENAGYILPQLDAYIQALSKFRAYMSAGDKENMQSFLASASENKKEMKTR